METLILSCFIFAKKKSAKHRSAKVVVKKYHFFFTRILDRAKLQNIFWKKQNHVSKGTSLSHFIFARIYQSAITEHKIKIDHFQSPFSSKKKVDSLRSTRKKNDVNNAPFEIHFEMHVE